MRNLQLQYYCDLHYKIYLVDLFSYSTHICCDTLALLSRIYICIILYVLRSVNIHRYVQTPTHTYIINSVHMHVYTVHYIAHHIFAQYILRQIKRISPTFFT